MSRGNGLMSGHGFSEAAAGSEHAGLWPGDRRLEMGPLRGWVLTGKATARPGRQRTPCSLRASACVLGKGG